MKDHQGSTVLLALCLAFICFIGGFLLGSGRRGTEVQIITEKAETTAPSAAPAEPTEGSSETQIDADFLININTADLEELMELPGIGETLAERILAYRQEHGAFASIEEIMEVSGIGETRFENMKDYITVEEPNEDTGG